MPHRRRFRAIVKSLIQMAIDGHWQAAKLILTYTLGKPGSASSNEELAIYMDEPPPPAPVSKRQFFDYWLSG